MIRTKKNLTLSVLAALGIGLAGPVLAGSGYGHSSADAMTNGAGTSIHSSSGYGSLDSAQYYGSGATSMSDSTGYTPYDSAYDPSNAPRQSADASVPDSSLYVLVAQPSLVFSDGVWYSFADGDWYALDDSGAWYSIADASAFDSGDYAYDTSAYDVIAYDGSAYHTTAYDGAAYDMTAYDSSGYDMTAEASDADWYYVTDATQDAGTLYSSDGVAWYDMNGDLVALAPAEEMSDSTISGPVASIDSIETVTYYFM